MSEIGWKGNTDSILLNKIQHFIYEYYSELNRTLEHLEKNIQVIIVF